MFYIEKAQIHQCKNTPYQNVNENKQTKMIFLSKSYSNDFNLRIQDKTHNYQKHCELVYMHI